MANRTVNIPFGFLEVLDFLVGVFLAATGNILNRVAKVEPQALILNKVDGFVLTIRVMRRVIDNVV